MNTILDKIIDNKLAEVQASKNSLPIESIIQKLKSALPPRDFYNAINPNGNLHIIAEIKRASPSKGVFRWQDFNPVQIAKGYACGGAAALSILTDNQFFKGKLDYLRQIQQEVAIPLLRKDFILDAYQIYESRLHGADALLLIVSALSEANLRDFLNLTHSLGMNAIVEVHDEREVDVALGAGSRIIGINNRNLKTFDVDLDISVRLSKRIPKEKIVIAESGVKAYNDIRKLREVGIHVFLIGETLMKACDPSEELKNLLRSSTLVEP